MITAAESRRSLLRCLRADARDAAINRRIEASVTRTRGVCGGRPCIAGTRIHIEICIVKPFFDGQSFAEIHRYYPYLKRQQIEDAVRWWGRHGARWRKVPVQPWRAPPPAVAAKRKGGHRG